jgi:carboxyl-terminal processing protease
MLSYWTRSGHNHRVRMRLLYVLLSGHLAISLAGAELGGETNLFPKKPTNVIKLVEGPQDALVAPLTARILERTHYLRKPFDRQVATNFFARYLDSLDNLHMYFLQSDLHEFEPFRATLDERTKRGDTTPARVIFNRFRERLDQQYDYVAELLKTERFDFSGSDRYSLNRKDLPRPQDLAAAHQLWRERLRFEYLQEKLNLIRPEEIGKTLLNKLNRQKPEQIREQIRASQKQLEALRKAAGAAAPDEAAAPPDKPLLRMTNLITTALADKLSDERTEEIVNLIEKKLGQAPLEAVIQAVVARLEQQNAEEIIKIIMRRYNRVLRYINECDNDDVLQFYLTALAHIYDPHSDYMGKSEFDNFSIGMKLSLFGIGAVLRYEDGITRIQALQPESPAEKSKKVKPNDKIIAVAQSNQPPVDVVDMPLRKVVQLIRGPKGTEVRLTMIPGDAVDPSVRKVVSLIRDEIKLEEQAAKAKVYEVPVGNNQAMRLGVIDLPSFYSALEMDRSSTDQRSTTADVARLLKKLSEEKVAGVILDLRRNGGGSLEEAISLSGLFINEGPIVQVKDADEKIQVDFDPNDRYPGEYYQGPMVVLTSRFSASASEILAGALQDYDRALIVGDASTHGKGTVQSLLQLAPLFRGQGLASTNNPGAVKVTIRKFYRASGESTQNRGVVPDIVLPSVYNDAKIGEASLDNALEWDKISSASFEKMNRIHPYLADVKQRSETRVNRDPDYVYLRGEIQRSKKVQDDKSVSLNAALRLKEKQEADERAKVRKRELAARPDSPDKVYELALKNVDQPGLPAPTVKTNSVKTARANGSPHGQPGVSAQPPAAEAGSVEGDPDESGFEESVPEIDIALEEAKRILADLITASTKNKPLVTIVAPKTK